MRALVLAKKLPSRFFKSAAPTRSHPEDEAGSAARGRRHVAQRRREDVGSLFAVIAGVTIPITGYFRRLNAANHKTAAAPGP